MDRIVHFVSVLFIYAMMVQRGNRSLKKIQMKKFGIAPRADGFTRKRFVIKIVKRLKDLMIDDTDDFERKRNEIMMMKDQIKGIK